MADQRQQMFVPPISLLLFMMMPFFLALEQLSSVREQERQKTPILENSEI